MQIDTKITTSVQEVNNQNELANASLTVEKNIPYEITDTQGYKITSGEVILSSDKPTFYLENNVVSDDKYKKERYETLLEIMRLAFNEGWIAESSFIDTYIDGDSFINFHNKESENEYDENLAYSERFEYDEYDVEEFLTSDFFMKNIKKNRLHPLVNKNGVQLYKLAKYKKDKDTGKVWEKNQGFVFIDESIGYIIVVTNTFKLLEKWRNAVYLSTNFSEE